MWKWCQVIIWHNIKTNKTVHTVYIAKLCYKNTHMLFLIELRQCVVCRENRYPSESGLLFCGSFVLLMSCVFHAFAPSLFIAALWSPAGKRLTSWLLFVMFYCVFVAYPCGSLGHVWYLIVSIPDRCQLSYSI